MHTYFLNALIGTFGLRGRTQAHCFRPAEYELNPRPPAIKAGLPTIELRIVSDFLRNCLFRIRAAFHDAVVHWSARFIRPLFGFGFDLTGAVYRIDGCQFEIPIHLTDRIYRSAFVFGEYEAAERKLVRRFLRPEDRVLELGGCIGVVSCLVNTRLVAPRHHLVVEANPELIPYLAHHRSLNRASFAIEECAVSTEPEVNFAVHRFMTHSSAFPQSDARLIRVRGRSLGNLHCAHGPFDALMIDVEGSELEILRASRDVLLNYRLVIIELHHEQLGLEGLEECRRILTSVGLKCSAVIQSVEAWIRPDPSLPEQTPPSTSWLPSQA
jgi:FkbM family methyltransferase